ncbi:hypothetical protein [Bradyrhizobium zhanjiangense]|uniref:hypothetical protein n=1 Tax=Bradyrhizobium zhanjiangense TaxID=1325107 RepID=UPI0010088B8D|nr:hypothetical protein [Bradyrhizobium zhanjiangense]
MSDVNQTKRIIGSLVGTNDVRVSFCSTRYLPVVEAMMDQKYQLQSLSADQLWSLRKDVDAKLARILLNRKNTLETRLEQLQPRSKEHLQIAR